MTRRGRRFGTASVGLPALALAALSLPLAAQDLGGAVTVGPTVVDKVQVQRALESCAANAPETSSAECLDRYWAPRWLLDEEAKSQALAQSPGAEHVLGDLLHVRLAETIARDVPEPSDAEVTAYIDKNKRDFEKPLRIRIFRILVATEDDAKSVIGKLSTETTIADFRKLAREYSLDRATNERAGDLGFVWPNGSTDIPQISAEESLYEAALELKDGEFSNAPVPEEKRFAVIWRRGSLPATQRSEQSARTARLRLIEERTEAELQKLLKKLESSVKSRDSLLLGKLRRKEATLFKEP